MIKDLHWAKYIKVILRNYLQNNFKEKTNKHIDQWNLNWIQVIDFICYLQPNYHGIVTCWQIIKSHFSIIFDIIVTKMYIWNYDLSNQICSTLFLWFWQD